MVKVTVPVAPAERGSRAIRAMILPLPFIATPVEPFRARAVERIEEKVPEITFPYRIWGEVPRLKVFPFWMNVASDEVTLTQATFVLSAEMFNPIPLTNWVSLLTRSSTR